jgi:hypothetical protein
MNTEKNQKIKESEELFSILNNVILRKCPGPTILIDKTSPIYKNKYGFVDLSKVDKDNPPPPPPIITYYDRNVLESLINGRAITYEEANYFYKAIDSTKTIRFDSSKVNVKVVPFQKLKPLFRDKTKNIFEVFNLINEMYGAKCILSVSTPIFDSTFTKALITYTFNCGSIDANEHLLVVLKQNNIWVQLENLEIR